MKTNNNWWYEATAEQRYAQVYEGAQLGMSIEQVAKNCRVKPIVVKWFARDHNIKFKEEKHKPVADGDFAAVAMVEAADTFGPPTEVSNIDWSFDFPIDIVEIMGDVVTSIVETWD